MNYITKLLDRKIDFLQFEGKTADIKIYYQVKLEFTLVYMLGYLWNQNLAKIEVNEKEQVLSLILKPSIGAIIQIIRTLDIENEFFGNKDIKKFVQKINKYPEFRNEKIGHGFSFEDDTQNILSFYTDFFKAIDEEKLHDILGSVNLIKVTAEDGNSFKGIIYESDGVNYKGWLCPKDVHDFKIGDIYIQDGHSRYFRISPFIFIQNESEIFTFCSIEEKLTGRTKFNRINKTEQKNIDVEEFEKLVLVQDNFKIKTANGTVINVFDKNYKKYIDIGITKQIINFLEKSRAFVFATIWGHGGVGKTASIQRVCEYLSFQEKKIFDYIIFLSAKDRYYNYYQGKIHNISDRITSLEDIISKINILIFNDDSYEQDQILNFDGKMFIIIDDFETFDKIEKAKILEFIKKLDINHHKVVLTTRAVNLITGEEIQTTELNKDESLNFFIESIKNEFPTYNTNPLINELNDDEIKNKVYEITFGRPLFILQLAILTVQKGGLKEATKVDISTTKEAINFLYDRIYEYLSLDAKNMFLAISLIAEENNLTGLLSNLKFILNKEDKEAEFQNSINELVKLKILTIEDKDFFKIYSLEIYNLMKLYYSNKGPEYDGNITNRYNLIDTAENYSTEEALLLRADASRMIENEAEVENRYRYILNRDKAPFEIKRTALLNFVKYLVTIKGKPFKAIKAFEDYKHVFIRDFTYIINFAPTCWAEGGPANKLKAIQILQEFLTLSPKNLDIENYLEVIGMLMTYKSILLVSQRDELKGRLRTQEIDEKEYQIYYKEQKDGFRDLLKYPGRKLWGLIKNIDIMTLSPICRNQVLDGLTHLAEICIRNNYHRLAKEICNKVIKEMPYNYHNPFLFKLQKIENINGKSNQFKSKTIEKVEKLTDFGQQLSSKIYKSDS